MILVVGGGVIADNFAVSKALKSPKGVIKVSNDECASKAPKKVSTDWGQLTKVREPAASASCLVPPSSSVPLSARMSS